MSEGNKSTREITIINKSETKRENRWEKLSKTLSIALIPVVLAITGFVIQERLQRQAIGRDYVQIAVTILKDPDKNKTSADVRSWAVDLLNDNSPTKFNQKAIETLKSGDTTFPADNTGVDNDPLGIAGIWTYTTMLKDNSSGYTAFRGVNTVILSNKEGYRMQGSRTDYQKSGNMDFQKYSVPKNIEFSRIGISPERDSFYFYFKVIDGGEQGFVDLQIIPPNKLKMTGQIHYLKGDGTWSIADIEFVRNE